MQQQVCTGESYFWTLQEDVWSRLTYFFFQKKHLPVVLVKVKIPSRNHKMEHLIRKYERCSHQKCDLRSSVPMQHGKKRGTTTHHTRFCPACMCDIMVTLCCPPSFRPSLPVGTFANFSKLWYIYKPERHLFGSVWHSKTMFAILGLGDWRFFLRYTK